MTPAIRRARAPIGVRREALPWACSAVLALTAWTSVSSSASAAEAHTPAAITAVNVQELVASARQQQADGHFAEARALYQQALQREPGSEVARSELSRLDAIVSGRAQPITLDQPGEELRQQAALAESRMAIGRAELLISGSRFEDAVTILSAARVALVPYAEDAVVRAEIQRIDVLLRDSRSRELVAVDGAGRAHREDARVTAEQRAQAGTVHQRSRFQERLARVIDFEGKELYESALSACRRLISDYPSEPEASLVFKRLLAKAHEQRRLTGIEQKVELLQEVQEYVERSLIPTGFDGWTIYPDGWSGRHAVGGGLDAPTALPAWHQAILEKLATRISYNFEAQNAVEALNALAKQSGINLIVDPSVYAGGDKLVTLKAANITLEHTLDWIARLIDARWRVAKGAVYVGGTEETEPILAVYDVSDLLFAPKDQPGKLLAFNAAGSGGGAGKGGGGFNLFKSAPDNAKPAASPEDLVDLLQKAVSPETWTKPEYAITIRGTTLMVTAPPSTHLLIQEFIRSQSKLKNILVKVDARWLTVNDGYMEEIGVQWNILNGLLNLPNGQTDGFARNTQDFAHNGRLDNFMPATGFNVQPASAGTGLNLQGTLLGATQLSAILTAVERDERGLILESPSVTTVSGVRANSFFGKQFAYIADYTMGGAVGALSATLDPTIEVLNLGASLDIKPFVSADGKYVTMEFRPALATLESLFVETLLLPRFQPIGNGGNGGNGVIIGTVVILPFPLELPNVKVREVSTTITVPDGGTLLVGGFGKYLEQTMSTKIPFLGHIPFLGRLFGQRGRYSDRSKLYLLADVHVINYAELEAKL